MPSHHFFFVISLFTYYFVTTLSSDKGTKHPDTSCCSGSHSREKFLELGNSNKASASLLDACNNDDTSSHVVTNKIEKKDNIVYVQGGSFFMGTDNPIIKYDGESPKRYVTVDSFYIDKYEVTNEMFNKFIKNTSYVTESENFGW